MTKIKSWCKFAHHYWLATSLRQTATYINRPTNKKASCGLVPKQRWRVYGRNE